LVKASGVVMGQLVRGDPRGGPGEAFGKDIYLVMSSFVAP